MSNNLKDTFWCEKYRPKILSDYIFHDPHQKAKIQECIDNQDIPHILLSGIQGSGKTALVGILLNELNILEIDTKIINASDKNSIDVVRDEIISFASSSPMGDFKVIVLEECDFISFQGQGALRRIMEDSCDQVRFILTCVTGDTIVYSPYGCSTIDSIGVEHPVLNNLSTVQHSKQLKTSSTNTLLHISTNHGNNIKVTPNHQFLSLTGPIVASDLHVDDSILINVRAMYGNSFEYENSDDFFDVNDFEQWLIDKNVPTVTDIINKLYLSFNDDKILSMGRLIGMLHGDGHISTSIHFAASNTSTLEKIIQDVCKFKQISVNISHNGRDSSGVCIQFSDISIQYLFEYFGATIGNKVKQSRRIPNHCHKSTLFCKGFIQGLFDADATWCTVHKNNKSITPIILNQTMMDTQIDDTYMYNIAELLNKFGIDSLIRITKSSGGRYGVHLNDRIIKQVQILSQQAIKQYLLCIGSYYDKPISDDILGYLMYKENQTGYGFDNFFDWKQTTYLNGHINSTVTNIENNRVEDTLVYDCCFDNHHWYVTNGFVSHNCNYEYKIIPAVLSRCTLKFRFKHPDKNDIAEFLINILIKENVKFDLDLLDSYIESGYPDIRTCLSTIQQYVINGKLYPLVDKTTVVDYKFKLIDLIVEDKWVEARKLVCSSIVKEEYEDVYRTLYENLDSSKKFQNKELWDEAIIVIGEYMFKHSVVADAEINLAALFISLGRL